MSSKKDKSWNCITSSILEFQLSLDIDEDWKYIRDYTYHSFLNNCEIGFVKLQF